MTEHASTEPAGAPTFTLDEVLAELDDMRAEYPEDIFVGPSPDATAAAMARHTCTELARRFWVRAARRTAEDGGADG